MNRIITLSALIFSVLSSSAQTSKETVLAGGSLSFSSTKTTGNSRITGFQIAPDFSKFYRDDRLAGIVLSYGHNISYPRQDVYGAGAYLRQYLPLGKSFFLFSNEGLLFTAGKHEEAVATPEGRRKYRDHSLDLSFYPGVAYGISKRLQLEVGLPHLVSLNYKKSELNYTNAPGYTDTKTSSIGLTTGISDSVLGYLTFGMKVALN